MKFQIYSGLLVLLLTTLSLTFQSAGAAPLSEEPQRVLYQVYVESFKDGSLEKLGQPTGSGNIEGLKQSLGYLKNLGVTGLLLMPIFESDGMGYIPNDFFLIRQSYALENTSAGRDQAFKDFTRAAHAAGVKVFLDAPINHIARGSDWFQKSARQQDGMEDWFLWSAQPKPGWRRPWQPDGKPEDVWHWEPQRNAFYYGVFSDWMPDLNHSNSAVIETFDVFFTKYAELGADGFRIDAARHLVEGEDNISSALPENLERLRSYLGNLRTRFPDQSFILEIWSGHQDIDPYLPTAGDVALDFPYMEALRDSLKYNHPYAVRRILHHFEATQNRIAPGSRIIFMGNHDIPRIRTFVQDDPGRVELSMALTFSLPQTPLLYYGDELFMPGDYLRDKTGATKLNEVCTPMAWTPGPNAGFTDPSVWLGEDWNRKLHSGWQQLNVQTQAQDSGSLLNLVRSLTAARKSLPLNSSTRTHVQANDSDPVLTVAMKFSDGSCTVGLYNFSGQTQYRRSASIRGICEDVGTGKQLIARRAAAAGRQGHSVDLLGHGFYVVRHFPARRTR